ncbi:hypothetical protein Tco_0128881 [Tanacetum coccineum]
MFIDSHFTLDYDNQMTDKYFAEYTGIEVKQFREILLQHMSNVKKSVAERTRHKTLYDRRVNKRHMLKQESKVDLGKALDIGLVVTESSGTEFGKQDTSSSANMTLSYEIHLTRLLEHVRIDHPYALSNDLSLVDYVMIPLSKKRVFRIRQDGKRPCLPTPTPSNSESSDSPSPSPHQGGERDPVNIYTLDPITYINQLSPIERGERYGLGLILYRAPCAIKGVLRKNTENLNNKIIKLNEELSDCETDLYNYKREESESENLFHDHIQGEDENAEDVQMADHLRPMEELLRIPIIGIENAIVVPAVLADEFELKTELLDFVSSNPFFGLKNDDPHSHIRRFYQITQTLRLNQVSDDVVKLILFPFSLKKEAETWIENEPPCSITTWDDLVSKYKPQVSSSGGTSTQIDAITALTKQVKALEYHFACMRETYEQNQEAAVQLMQNQMGQMADFQERPLGELPSNIRTNPLTELKLITSTDVLTLNGSFLSHSNFLEREQEPETITEVVEIASSKSTPLKKNFQALDNPTGRADHFIYRIDIVDNLSIKNNSLSGSLTLSPGPVVESLSSSLTPSREIDLLLEETDPFLSLDDLIPPGINNGIYDSEGDIIFLEGLLNDEIPRDLPLLELNNNPEGDILFLENLLKDDHSKADKSEIYTLIGEPPDTFLMEDEEIKLNPLKDSDDSVPIPRVSVTPLDSLDSFFDSFDISYTNPSELDSEYTLNYDNLIFNIQNEHCDEHETETIMDEIPSDENKVHIEVLSVLWENRLPIPDGLFPLSRHESVEVLTAHQIFCKSGYRPIQNVNSDLRDTNIDLRCYYVTNKMKSILLFGAADVVQGLQHISKGMKSIRQGGDSIRSVPGDPLGQASSRCQLESCQWQPVSTMIISIYQRKIDGVVRGASLYGGKVDVIVDGRGGEDIKCLYKLGVKIYTIQNFGGKESQLVIGHTYIFGSQCRYLESLYMDPGFEKEEGRHKCTFRQPLQPVCIEARHVDQWSWSNIEVGNSYGIRVLDSSIGLEFAL